MSSPQPTEAQMEAAREVVRQNFNLRKIIDPERYSEIIADAIAAAHREGMMRAAEIARGSSGEYDFQAALAEGRDFDYGFHNGKNHAADSVLAEIILSEAEGEE